MTTLDREAVEMFAAEIEGAPLRVCRDVLAQLVGALKSERAVLSPATHVALRRAKKLLEGTLSHRQICQRCHETVPEWFLEEFDLGVEVFALEEHSASIRVERFCRHCTEDMPYPLDGGDETEDQFVERWLPIKALRDSRHTGTLDRQIGVSRKAPDDITTPELQAAWLEGWDAQDQIEKETAALKGSAP